MTSRTRFEGVAKPAEAGRPSEQFQRWLETPDAPATMVYHTGHLAEDAEGDRELRALAAAALYASGALPCTRRTGTGRKGQPVQPDAGPARVALTKRRLGDGVYEYRATRLPRRHREDPTR